MPKAYPLSVARLFHLYRYPRFTAGFSHRLPTIHKLRLFYLIMMNDLIIRLALKSRVLGTAASCQHFCNPLYRLIIYIVYVASESVAAT